MANVYPFAAWLALGEKAPAISSLPYDVMNRSEAKEMAGENKMSFLRITRAEIELPDSLSPYQPEVYQRAAENWRKWCADGSLQQDSAASYYVYSLLWQGRRQTGVVAAASVDDYDNEVIRKHERTRKEKEDDRTQHISTLRAQTGPVFLICPDTEEIAALTAIAMNGQPLFDFLAPGGIRHSGWRLPAAYNARMQAAFAAIPRLYIADGHHRAASASRTRARLAEQGETLGQADKFLSVIFPAGQLAILPYNRLIQDFNGLSCEEFLQSLKNICTLTPTDKPSPEQAGQICLYCQKRWYRLDFHPEKSENPIDRLDVSQLQNKIIAPILGIHDPRTDSRIDFVGGIRGTEELEKQVDSGRAALAFSMYPTSVEQLMEISDANETMPPKSTWFEPKLRDGLFVHAI